MVQLKWKDVCSVLSSATNARGLGHKKAPRSYFSKAPGDFSWTNSVDRLPPKKRLELLGWSNDTTFPRSFSYMKDPFRDHVVKRHPVDLLLSKNLNKHSLFPASGDMLSFL